MVTGGAFMHYDGVGMLVLGCSFWGGSLGAHSGQCSFCSSRCAGTGRGGDW